MFLTKITIVCFFGSYVVTLLLDVTRLLFRAPIRIAVMWTFAVAGLFAHSVYLWLRVQEELPSASPLSNWHDWCLLIAWTLTATYLLIGVWRPESAAGMFILPLVLILIGLAYIYRDAPSFPREQALTVWGVVHGIALLLGTIVVALGFVAGVMYLIQSYRLKHKLPPSEGIKLPSLEWLQKENERALVISSVLLGVGLLSGIVLNLIRSNVVAWSDPVVWSSGVLFLWLATVLTFNFIYKPARRGRKVAYLVVASFLFFALELGIVLFAQHATPPSSPNVSTVNAVTGGES